MIEVRHVGGKEYGHDRDATVACVSDGRNDPVTGVATRPSPARPSPAMQHAAIDLSAAGNGNGVSCRVQSWSFHPDIAHLVLKQHNGVPSLADVREWTNRIGTLGYTAVRTNALTPGVGRQLENAGYVVLQDLVLLEHTTPRSVRSEVGALGTSATRSLDSNQLATASAVDLAAFGTQWGLSATAIADACKATPRYRIRGIGEPLAGYAVSGRDGSQGFLQRLSVEPERQRQGLGRALVIDSLVWMARWRVQRVLVNTALDNEAALSLYQGLGFRRVGEHLRVYERNLP